MQNWIRQWLIAALGFTAFSSGVFGYGEPRVARIEFDPAGVVLEDGIADRLPDLLVGLATDFPAATDRQRGAALAVALRFDPDNQEALAANRDLVRGVEPDKKGLGMKRPDAVAELWRLASQIHSDALTEDEKIFARYLTGVVLLFAEEKDPRFARARKIIGKDKVWAGILP